MYVIVLPFSEPDGKRVLGTLLYVPGVKNNNRIFPMVSYLQINLY